MEERKRKEKETEAENVGNALLKVALGCSVAEVTEEYAEVDGKLKLLKRKKTKKDIPPDLKAVQLLLEKSGEKDVGGMSDEELEREKTRLLAALESERVKGDEQTESTAVKQKKRELSEAQKAALKRGREAAKKRADKKKEKGGKGA